MKDLERKGMCDPHIRIFNNRACLSAFYNLFLENTGFVMPDRWIWFSDDLLTRKYE
jgi:hypothetical protein